VAYPVDKHDWATNGIDSRSGDAPNLVKSLFLDPAQLNNHNLLLKEKYSRMKREDVRYEAYNADGDYRALIVSYGTMSRVCRTAIDFLKDDGLEVAMIRPQTLFPFPEAAIRDAAGKDGCRVAISIEMSMGQMVEDVERSVQGRCPVEWYGKCGGEVPTPEEVMDVVRGMLNDG
jgi:2-oxoglutarate ferredoxin oxidoreductase subunit alpha